MAGRERGKKVVVILGSPRKKGNSAILAAHIAGGAKRAGATGGNGLSPRVKHRPLPILLRLPEAGE